ncbi:hypothetical protein [Polaromonas sp. UBA4122]|nr:hypothetical protein [Polaromonas sp. UBA4122]
MRIALIGKQDFSMATATPDGSGSPDHESAGLPDMKIAISIS